MPYTFYVSKTNIVKFLDPVPRVYKTSSLNTISNMFQYPVKIIDNVYLGNIYCAFNGDLLKKFNIKYILNCSIEIPNIYNSYIHYYKLNLNDLGCSINYKSILDSIKFIEKSQLSGNKNILVHCFAGRSRSVSIIICYLINKYNFTAEYALDFIKKKRKFINPSNALFNSCKNFYKFKNA